MFILNCNNVYKLSFIQKTVNINDTQFRHSVISRFMQVLHHMTADRIVNQKANKEDW